jgi:hypothetical protein
MPLAHRGGTLAIKTLILREVRGFRMSENVSHYE